MATEEREPPVAEARNVNTSPDRLAELYKHKAAALRAVWRETMGTEVVARLDQIHPSIDPQPVSRAAAATDLNPLQICLEQGVFRPKDLVGAYISVYGVAVHEARRLAASALEWIADERPDAVQCDIETLREIARTFRQAADDADLRASGGPIDYARPRIKTAAWNQAMSYRTRIVVNEEASKVATAYLNEIARLNQGADKPTVSATELAQPPTAGIG